MRVQGIPDRSPLGALKQVARAIRRRQAGRARVAFYGQFVDVGDLVFDVGANVGDFTAAFAALGARVVAVEPQPECVAELQRRFGASDRVSIVPQALGATSGTETLFTSSESTLGSMSPEFIERTRDSGRFAEFEWSGRQTVETTTLDALIAAHGLPAFCKIDVEGYEEQVLAGLSLSPRMLSLEFVPERMEATLRCLERLERLGPYRLNLVRGDRRSLALPTWVDGPVLARELERLRGTLAYADVYARIEAP